MHYTVDVTIASRKTVSGTIHCSDLTPTCFPDHPLAYGTPFTVTITTDIADKAGNTLEDEVSSTFCTLVPDTTLVAAAGDDFDVDMGEAVTLSGAGSHADTLSYVLHVRHELGSEQEPLDRFLG